LVTKPTQLSDHFSGTLLLGSFADLWASFFVADSSVQDLPDQAAKFVGNYSNGLIVSQTRHIAAIENLEDASAGKENPNRCAITRQPTELLERKLELSLLHQAGWKARKHPAAVKYFFLTFPFIELIRTWLESSAGVEYLDVLRLCQDQ
jgi:hypothetical protein